MRFLLYFRAAFRTLTLTFPAGRYLQTPKQATLFLWRRRFLTTICKSFSDIPVLSFIAGIFIAEAIHARFKYSEKIHWRQGVLLIEIILLFAVGFLPTTLNRLANALVSFVCAFQVQTFHKVRGHAYASTMCIGNMRSGTEALHAYFHTHDKGALKKSLTYFSVIIIFFLGAALGSVFTKQLETKAVFFCCALLLISFLMMFSKKSKKHS